LILEPGVRLGGLLILKPGVRLGLIDTGTWSKVGFNGYWNLE